ncbi:hypothetical protein PIB30_036542 [Stylosanthes scabra]|uniref:BLOC-1-related complex subunit 7 n=1 Tax=Stylosanthes scabra TaxID=79078 RepID=A0ABU6UCU8_9FABA|nr:hypothetical protein [Stylosanthes scabra]
MSINKVSDLSSISVFPPPPILHNSRTRRPTTVPSGLQASQQSQPSFSQGLSSQPGMLSHFSQNSLDEAVTNDQRVGSQEQENSLRNISSFPRLTYSREESQTLNSKSSSNLMIKWNSAEHRSKGQLNEGLDHRISTMETSLRRFAMILDSTKGQEEIKASIDESLKSILEQMSKATTDQEKLQEMYSVVSTLPQLIEASIQSIQSDLHNSTTEMQARMICQ